MRQALRYTFFLGLGLAQGAAAADLAPLRSHNAIIAGTGLPGHQDGYFLGAEFNGPSGIAFDPMDQCLYVADTGNHSIRKIDLKNGQAVSTVADAAQGLSQPSEVALWDKGRALLFFDQNSQSLKKMDLYSHRVDTLLSAGQPLGQLLVHEDGQVYVSAPVAGQLWQVDTSTGNTINALSHPSFRSARLRMASFQGRLCAYNPDDGGLISFKPLSKGAQAILPSDIESLSRSKNGEGLVGVHSFAGDKLLTWNEAEGCLGAIYPGDEEARQVPSQGIDGENLGRHLVDPKGQLSDNPLYRPALRGRLHFAFDSAGHRLYVSEGTLNRIRSIAYQGLRWESFNDFGIAPEKPAGTRRVLFVGSSVLMWRGGGSTEPPQSFPKRFELFSNLRNAQAGCPMDVESMVYTRGGPWFGGSAISCYPRLAELCHTKEYGVDEVVFIVHLLGLFQEAFGFARAPSVDDVVVPDIDEAWNVSSMEERARGFGPISRKLYAIFKKSPDRFNEGLRLDANRIMYAEKGYMYAAFVDPEIRELSEQILHKALQKLAANAKKDGMPVRIVMLPEKDQLACEGQNQAAPIFFEDFLKRDCESLGIPFTDLIPAMRLADPLVYPLFDDQHMSVRGHLWMGYLLSNAIPLECGR